jgi:hypothetical protein
VRQRWVFNIDSGATHNANGWNAKQFSSGGQGMKVIGKSAAKTENSRIFSCQWKHERSQFPPFIALYLGV